MAAVLTLGLAVVPPAPIAAASSESDTRSPPFESRGREVEKRQRALHHRLESFRTTLETTLRRDEPELLETLEPPPSSVPGYQVLPTIVDDEAPPPPGTKSELVTYGWVWSETLIQREMSDLDRLESELERLAAPAPADRADDYRKLIAAYRQAQRDRKTIDSDIDYNWDWQRRIANDRPLFDRLESTQRKVLERDRITAALSSSDRTRLREAARKATLDVTDSDEPLRDSLMERVATLDAEIAAARAAVQDREFVSIDGSAGGRWVVSIKLLTDITDREYLAHLRRCVEKVWRVQADGEERSELAVRLTIKHVSPHRLYCAPRRSARKAAPCAPPAPGALIDVEAHVGRFPSGAVLTTGARTVRLVDDRAIVLGPHDLSGRVVAHELGHVLGFPDAYFRGYRDVGADGFQVTELADFGDIMGAPGAGPVLPRHFEELRLAKARRALDASLRFYRAGRFRESIVASREAVRLKPDFAPGWNNLSAAYASLGRFGDAVHAAEEALRLDPDFELAKRNLAWARSGRDKGQAAQ